MIPGATRNCILLYLSQQDNPAQYAALPLFGMLADTNPINSRFARKGNAVFPCCQLIKQSPVPPKKRYTAAPYTHPVCLYLPMIKRKSRKPATYSHAESTCGNASPHKIPTTNGINSRRKGCRCQLSIINPEDGLQIP